MATSAREVLVLLSRAVADYEGLDFRAVGAQGRALSPAEEPEATAEEARA
jgi:hypothetical protein